MDAAACKTRINPQSSTMNPISQKAAVQHSPARCSVDALAVGMTWSDSRATAHSS